MLAPRMKRKTVPPASVYLLKGSNTVNLVAGVDHSGGSSLRPHEDNVNKGRRRWHGVHLLKVVNRHVVIYLSFKSNQIKYSNSKGNANPFQEQRNNG